MERILHVVTISVLAFLIQSHWKVEKRTDTYVEYYLTLNWTVEDMKVDMESKTAEYVNKYMQIETNKMDEKNSKMIEENLAQMRTKVIQLETTISQLNDNDKSQIQIRKALETKVKQMETKLNYQELLIFALKSQRPSTESEFNSQYKILGNSFSGESSDFRTCHGLRSVDPFLPSGMYWIDPDGMGVGEEPIYVFCNMTTEFQKWIGFADVKSTTNFFYVWRSVEFYEAGVPIPFDYGILNTGNVVDLSTGIFTATTAGTYFFAFAGMAKFPAESFLQSLGISLHLNDDLVAYDGSEFNDLRNEQRTKLTSQTMLELKPGDQICLKFTSNSEKPNVILIAYFIGWMLEEKTSESLGFSLRDD